MNSLLVKLSPKRWAAVILPLFVLGLFLDWHHELSFQHEVCPIDGGLTHVSETHDHGSNHDSHHGEPTEEGQEDEEHEHCGLPSLGMSSDAPAATHSLGFVHLTLSVPIAKSAELQLAEQQLFLLAPKNSPPARG